MGRFDALIEDIRRLAKPICDDLGIDIVELNLHSYNEVLVIQILADRPTGGITIDECTALNQKVDKILYDELKLGDNYTLEVSSPGLDRWLHDYRDFRRTIGQNVHIFLNAQVKGKKEIIGRLKGVRESELMMEVKNEEWLIPMDKIEKGRQIII